MTNSIKLKIKNIANLAKSLISTYQNSSFEFLSMQIIKMTEEQLSHSMQTDKTQVYYTPKPRYTINGVTDWNTFGLLKDYRNCLQFILG